MPIITLPQLLTFSASWLVPHPAQPTTRTLQPVTRTPQLATSNQTRSPQLAIRYQKTVNRCQKRDIPPSKRHALCALPYAHNPAPRNSAPRTPYPVPRTPKLATRLTFIDHQAVSIHKHRDRNNPRHNPIQGDRASVWVQHPQIAPR